MNRKSPWIAYWSVIPSPYVVERYNALARRGNLRFEAWFNRLTERGRSWEVDTSQWMFSYRLLPSVGLGRRVTGFPTPLLRNEVPDLLVTLHADPGFLLGLGVAKTRGIRTAIWVLPTYESWVRRRWWKELIKGGVFAWADGLLTSGFDGRQALASYNVSDEKIHYLPHDVVDFPHFFNGACEARLTGNPMRDRLGLSGVTFIYVGRLWHGKGLDTLLKAFRDVQKDSQTEVSLLLVGDGDDEAQLKRTVQSDGLKNVVFAGFQQKSKLPMYYAAGDIFVFPTLGDPFGHVVSEAMSCGLPVITTSAAGEIYSRVRQSIEGYIVAPGDSHALAEKMIQLVMDSSLRKQLGEAAARRMRDRTPDLWAEEFERAVMASLLTSES